MNKNYLEETLGESRNIPVIRTLWKEGIHWTRFKFLLKSNSGRTRVKVLHVVSNLRATVCNAGMFCLVLFYSCVLWSFLKFFFLGGKTWVQFTRLNKRFSLPQNCVFQNSFIQLRKCHPALGLALRQDRFSLLSLLILKASISQNLL